MTEPKNKPMIVLTNADGLAEMNTPALVFLLITREEIETLNYTSALERLMVMADSRESTLLYRDSLVLHVQGYDADRRELPEIPEVRAFFAKLTDAWPHWMWFLSREAGTVSLLMSLLCKVKIHRQGGSYGVEFIDLEELDTRLEDLLDRGISLFEAFDIEPSDAEESAISAISMFTTS